MNEVSNSNIKQSKWERGKTEKIKMSTQTRKVKREIKEKFTGKK